MNYEYDCSVPDCHYTARHAFYHCVDCGEHVPCPYSADPMQTDGHVCTGTDTARTALETRTG